MPFKGTITLTYVSTESLAEYSLGGILEECDSGSAVAGPMTHAEEPISLEEARRLAEECGSDASFFDDERDDEESHA